MIRRGALLPALAAMLASGCGQPASKPEPSHDEGAAQVADERAAEAAVADRVMLARLARDVAELHVEVDRLKASRETLRGELLEARLQALERAAPPAAAEPVPEPKPAANAPARPQPRHTPTATERTEEKDGGR